MPSMNARLSDASDGRLTSVAGVDGGGFGDASDGRLASVASDRPALPAKHYYLLSLHSYGLM